MSCFTPSTYWSNMIARDTLLTREETRKLVDDEPFLYATKGTLTDDNDELRRSPGTPIFTTPECCLGEDQFSYLTLEFFYDSRVMDVVHVAL
ncbi:hypothetical protein GIB67_034298 [Kingdonia uniflora]|uniref:Uncharacterized protein n=1 Tax=Kingdonia uniflora TaxID=39325 RepID=A0A7J7NRU9_9MAGN|nr:hypothetical protein GIB67_034298 [Kingdonia uniflora]